MLKKTSLIISLSATLIIFALVPATDITSPANAQSTSTQGRGAPISLQTDQDARAQKVTTDITSPANAQSTYTQGRGAPISLQTDQDARAQKVIDDSVLKVKDMLFPKVAPPPDAKTSDSFCQPYDMRNINGVAGIDLSTPKGYSKSKFVPSDGPREEIYSPPLGVWVISSYNRNVISANNPYDASHDAQPANFHYLTSSEFESTLNEMKNYVGSLNIANKFKADFNLKLEEFVRNYGKYSNEISTSHGQVRHRARVQGRGMFNGSSWYRAEINTTEVCSPPELRDAGELKKTLKAWVDQAACGLNAVGNSIEPVISN